jgi:2-octaprenylphenol hydroxylase
VCVLEPQRDATPPRGEMGVRTYALTPAARAVLEHIGAWQRLDRTRLGHFTRMEVWDARSRGRIHFDPPPAQRGPMGWIVEHQNLTAALAAAAATMPGLEWRPTAFAGVEGDGPLTITCGDGARLQAWLLVGADGAGSQVRAAAGIPVTRSPYGQRALACNVVTQRPHGNVARQRFLPTGPLAFLPLPDPYASAIVWSCDDALANELTAAGDEAFAATLAEAFDQALGTVTGVGPRAWFPLERAGAAQMVAGHCVLIGDAAHVVHPLAGQGLNLGILDAAALAECVGARESDGPWPRASRLRRFERWRKSEALALTFVTDGLQRLFRREGRAIRTVRGMGMRLTDRALPVKQWLIERAMGFAGDVPAVARAGGSGADG